MPNDFVLLDPRLEAAEKARIARDANLPRLQYWNYEPCQYHNEPQVQCQYELCGGELFQHQRVGIAYLYLIEKAVLADVPGAGKTITIAGLLALLKQRGELTDRAVLIVNTPSVRQWYQQLKRWIPGVNVTMVDGSLNQTKRVRVYASDWDVLLIGNHLAVNDREYLLRLEPGFIAIDDVDPLLNHNTTTHQSLVEIADGARRSVEMNATNVQVRLQQLHAALAPVGGYSILGSLIQFESRYVRKDSAGITVGYRNLKELKRKVAPYILRRNYADLTDVRMPIVMPPENVWLDLYPAQRDKYDELQAGVLRILKEEGEKVKRVQAFAKWTYGQQICAGLPALGESDGPGASVKLDWIERKLRDEFEDEKVMIFAKNPNLIRALHARLDRYSIGYATIWGQNQNAMQREDERKRFWQDPNCKVIVGTTAMERSLNLQVARIGIYVDQHPNPARMFQLLGRYRRPGGADRVFVFNLLSVNTQEQRILDLLQTRQALADYLNDESNELYEALSPLALMNLIGGVA